MTISLFKRSVALCTASCISFAGMAQAAPAADVAPPLITAAEVAQAAQGSAGSAAHVQLVQTLSRADVAAALQARGVSVQAARDRVAALTDEEAARVAAEMDAAPAGGDAIGTIVFIFVLLLITDILGFTKIFPFTRSIR
jgi:hypothetical protein